MSYDLFVTQEVQRSIQNQDHKSQRIIKENRDILTYQIWRFLRNKFLFILTFVADWKVLPTVLAQVTTYLAYLRCRGRVNNSGFGRCAGIKRFPLFRSVSEAERIPILHTLQAKLSCCHNPLASEEVFSNLLRNSERIRALLPLILIDGVQNHNLF